MARKDLPYLPLYVQDFMTDERLNECSASSTGVYIKIMCVLHKSIPYGKFLLRQKDKQKDKQIENFAIKFAKHVAFPIDVILLALEELISEECLKIEDDFIYQKRMVEDGELSLTRSKSGELGGKSSSKKNKNFATAKTQANSDIDNDIKYIVNSLNLNGESDIEKNILAMIVKEMMDRWMQYKPTYSILITEDYTSLLQIAYIIAEKKGWDKKDVLSIKEKDVVKSWTVIVEWLTGERQSEFYKTMPLDKICSKKAFRDIEERMKTTPILSAIKMKEMEKGRINPEDYFNQ